MSGNINTSRHIALKGSPDNIKDLYEGVQSWRPNAQGLVAKDVLLRIIGELYHAIDGGVIDDPPGPQSIANVVNGGTSAPTTQIKDMGGNLPAANRVDHGRINTAVAMIARMTVAQIKLWLQSNNPGEGFLQGLVDHEAKDESPRTSLIELVLDYGEKHKFELVEPDPPEEDEDDDDDDPVTIDDVL